jgi:hypothetical protein
VSVIQDKLGNLELAIDEKIVDLRREMLHAIGNRLGTKAIRIVAALLRVAYMRGYEDHRSDRGAMYREHGQVRSRR